MQVFGSSNIRKLFDRFLVHTSEPIPYFPNPISSFFPVIELKPEHCGFFLHFLIITLLKGVSHPYF